MGAQQPYPSDLGVHPDAQSASGRQLVTGLRELLYGGCLFQRPANVFTDERGGVLFAFFQRRHDG